jgi:acetyl esterase/lipase
MNQRRLFKQNGKGIPFALAAAFCLAGFAWNAAADEPAAPTERGAPGISDVQIIRDVVYRPLYEGEDGSRDKNKLDLYIPRGKKDFPVIFFVHGGAWLHGNKDQFGMYSVLALSWARHGIGTVSINYRLSPGVKHPEHIKDVARAFAWTRKNIARYGGRPDQIFACGHSAGGHLVALLATDERYLRAEDLSPKDIRGVIPISGVYRIHDLQINAGISRPAGTGGANAAPRRTPGPLFSSVFGSDREVRRDASPLFHVKSGLPPFLVLYADYDLPQLPEMAREFNAALKAQKCEVQTVEIQERNHISILLSLAQDGDPAGQAILDFVARHSRKP